MKLIYALIILLIGVQISTAQVWKRTGGPGVGIGISQMTYNGDKTTYAGMTSFNGIFKTNNGGTTWASGGLGTYRILSIHHLEGNQLIAGTNGSGIFWTNNDGATWANVGLDGISVTCFARLTSSKILAGTRNSGLYISENNGQNWAPLDLDGKTILDILVDGNSKAYVATQNDSVYYSVDGGDNWLWYDLKAKSLAIDDNGIIYAGDLGLKKSIDNGQTWINAGLDNVIINRVFILSNNHILIGAVGNTYKSEDGGGSWEQFNTGFPQGSTINDFSETKDGFVYASSEFDNFVYKSVAEIAYSPLKLFVTPTAKQQRSYNQSITYNIKVTDANTIPFAGAKVVIQNGLLETEEEVTTDAQGNATFTTTVPNGKRNDTYTLAFTAIKPGYQRSETLSRQLEVLQLVQLVATITPSSLGKLDWGDEVDFDISVKTSLGVIMPNVAIAIKDELNNFNQEIIANAEGKATYKLVVPENTPDGDYAVTFQAKLQGFIESTLHERKFSVKKIYKLKMQIFPEEQIEKMWWDTLQYEIFVKDDLDRLIPNVDINGVNNVNNASIFLRTNGQGTVKYEFVVPWEKVETIYTIRFVCFKTDFTNSDEFIRTVKVIRNPMTVDYVNYDTEFNIMPNPSNDIAQLNFKLDNSEYVNIELSDVTGNQILRIANAYMTQGMNSIAIPVNNLEQGMYIVRMQAGKVTKATKLMVIEN